MRLAGAILLLSVFLLVAADCFAVVSVKGYQRKDGTNVSPHFRSEPDQRVENNYSFPGNLNPSTEEVSRGKIEAYLEQYFEKADAVKKQ